MRSIFSGEVREALVIWLRGKARAVRPKRVGGLQSGGDFRRPSLFRCKARRGLAFVVGGRARLVFARLQLGLRKGGQLGPWNFRISCRYPKACEAEHGKNDLCVVSQERRGKKENVVCITCEICQPA